MHNKHMKSFAFYWSLLVVMVWFSVAHSAELPLSKIDSTETGFDTMETAAVEGIKIAMVDSEKVEYAGAVYSLDGKFYHTIPVSQNDDTGVDYRIQIPPKAKLVAIFHTHPECDTPRTNPFEFSYSDTKTARDVNLVMYVGVVHNHTGLHFDPSSGKKDKIKLS